jgi:hypothetical protein
MHCFQIMPLTHFLADRHPACKRETRRHNANRNRLLHSFLSGARRIFPGLPGEYPLIVPNGPVFVKANHRAMLTLRVL